MPADLSVAVIGAAAVIIASIIGLIVAVTTAVIAKEQKVSEFRQAWIDAFRQDAADLYTLMLQSNHHIYNANRLKLICKKYNPEDNTPPKANEMLLVFNEKCTEATTKLALIRFRLNPHKEKKYINNATFILRDMSDYKDCSNLEALEILHSDLQNRIHLLSDDIHTILKSEWERVKRGEKRYIMFVTVGEFFGATFIIAFYVLLALVKFPEYFPRMFN